MYKRSTVLFSGLDATLTKTGRLADGGSRFFFFLLCLTFEKRATTRFSARRSDPPRQDCCRNFGHRSERRGDDVTFHHHLGSRLSTTCIIGASSEFTQNFLTLRRPAAPQYAGFVAYRKSARVSRGLLALLHSLFFRFISWGGPDVRRLEFFDGFLTELASKHARTSASSIQNCRFRFKIISHIWDNFFSRRKFTLRKESFSKQI